METHFCARWVFRHFLFWQLFLSRPSLAPVGCRWVMWALTSSGVVVMNLPPPPPFLCIWACVCVVERHAVIVSVSLHSGIEQSLSFRLGEAENIYENPEDIRQVTNLDISNHWIFSDGFFSISPPSSNSLLIVSVVDFFCSPLISSVSLCHLLFIKPIFWTLPTQQANPAGSVYMVSYCVLPCTYTDVLCICVCVRSCVTPIFSSANSLSPPLLVPP